MSKLAGRNLVIRCAYRVERGENTRTSEKNQGTGSMKRTAIKRKPKRDKTFKDGRKRLANKSELRRQVYERAEGRCEVIEDGFRCGADAPWDGWLTVRGHLAHNRHGAYRSDEPTCCHWSCASHHLRFHGLRSGKIPGGHSEN